MATCFPTQPAIYCYAIICVLTHGYCLVSIIRLPYLNLTESALQLATHVTMIFNPAFIIIWHHFQPDRYSMYYIFFFALYALALFLAVVYYTWREGQNRVLLRSDNQNLPLHKALSLLQYAITRNEFPMSLCDLFRQIVDQDTSSVSMIAFYLVMLMQDQTTFPQSLELMSQILEQITYETRAQHFAAFILQKVQNDREPTLMGMSSFEIMTRRVEKVREEQSEFWVDMVAGYVQKGQDMLENMELELRILHRDFMMFKTYYGNVPAIEQLQTTFFGPLFARSKQELPIQFGLDSSSSSHISNSESSTRNDTELASNMPLFLDRNTPLYYHFLSFIVLLFVVGFCIFLINPSFSMAKLIDPILTLPGALNRTLIISQDWAKIVLAYLDMCNCSDHIGFGCDDGMFEHDDPDNDWIICDSLPQIYASLHNLSDELTSLLRILPYDFSSLSQNTALLDVRNAWDYPRISMSPNESLLYNSIISVKAAMIHYAGNIRMIGVDETAWPEICESRYHDLTCADSNTIFNVSFQIFHEMADSLHYYPLYIEEERLKMKASRSTGESVGILLFALFAFIMLVVVSAVKDYVLFLRLAKHLRPTMPPTGPVEVEYSETIEPFKYKFSAPWRFIFLAVIFILFIIQWFVVWDQICSSYDTLLNECNVIAVVQSLSVYTTTVITSVFRAVYYPEQIEDALQRYDSFSGELLSAMRNLNRALSPVKIPHLLTNDLPGVLQYKDSPPNAESFHDTYSNWPGLMQMNLAFMLTEMCWSIDNLPLTTDNSFSHIGHLYLVHLQPGFLNISTVFAKYATDSAEQIATLLNLENFLLAIALTAVLIASTYDAILFDGLYKAPNRQVQALSPLYIAENQVLMNFVLPSTESLREKKQGPYLKLYDESDRSIIILSDKYTMIGFTVAVQKQFGFRTEQLIGQSAELLFPELRPDHRGESGFYRQLQLTRRHQASSSFSRVVDGRSSENVTIQLLVSVGLVEYEGSEYFMINLKAVTEQLYYEEYIQRHTDAFNEIYEGSLPVILFQGGNTDMGNCTRKVFQHGIYLTMQLQEKVMLTFGEEREMEDLVYPVRVILPYFEGQFGTIVIDASPNRCILLFVDKDKNTAISNARTFIESYVNGLNGRIWSAIMIEESPTEVAMFHLPDLPENYSVTQIPLEVATKMVPQMTIEALSPMIGNLQYYGTNSKPGTIIVSESIKDYLHIDEEPLHIPAGKMKNITPIPLFQINADDFFSASH